MKLNSYADLCSKVKKWDTLKKIVRAQMASAMYINPKIFSKTYMSVSARVLFATGFSKILWATPLRISDEFWDHFRNALPTKLGIVGWGGETPEGIATSASVIRFTCLLFFVFP